MKRLFVIAFVVCLMSIPSVSIGATYYFWICPTSITRDWTWEEDQENYQVNVYKGFGSKTATYWINLRYRWDENWSEHSIVASLGPFKIKPGEDLYHDLEQWSSYFQEGLITEYIIEVKITDESRSSQSISTTVRLNAWHTEWDDSENDYVGFIHAVYYPILFKTAPK